MRFTGASRMFAGAALLAAVWVRLTGWATSLVSISAWLLGFFVAFNLLEASIPALLTCAAGGWGTVLGGYNTA